MHTKLWFGIKQSMRHQFGALTHNLQMNQVEKGQRTAVQWTCRIWRNTSSAGEMLDELEWLSL